GRPLASISRFDMSRPAAARCIRLGAIFPRRRENWAIVRRPTLKRGFVGLGNGLRPKRTAAKASWNRLPPSTRKLLHRVGGGVMLEKPNPMGRDDAKFDDFPVSIVIPLYNEQTIMWENLEALAPFYDQLLGAGNWLFILVDNGSTDTTPRWVTAALDKWPLSRAVHLADPNYGAALKAGLRSASTKWIYLLDIEQWDLPFLAWAWGNRDCYDL